MERRIFLQVREEEISDCQAELPLSKASHSGQTLSPRLQNPVWMCLVSGDSPFFCFILFSFPIVRVTEVKNRGGYRRGKGRSTASPSARGFMGTQS
ncbi:uncharacterized [Tachysurus ichikawai]